MIGRRLLTRMTRLGLSMYAAIWCMSFTVCAYDDPIADMAVSGRAALLTEAAGDAADAELVPGDEDPSGGAVLVDEPDVTDAEDPEDAGSVDAEAEGMDDPDGEDIEGLADDEVIEDVSEEDAVSTLMSIDTSTIYFNVSNLTITNISKSYKVSLLGTDELENIDPEETQYGFSGLSDSEKEGISLTLDENKSFVISFNDKWDDSKNTRFQLTDTYTFSDEYQFNATLNISVYAPVKGMYVSAYSEGECIGTSSELNLGYYDASDNLTLTLSGYEDHGLDADRISWTIWNPVSGNKIDPDSNTDNITLKDDPSNPGITKILGFNDSFTRLNLEIRVHYNNNYTDAEGNTKEGSRPYASCCLIAIMPDVDGIVMMQNALTINDIHSTYNFTVESRNGAAINTSNLTFKISPTDSIDDAVYDNYDGLNMTTLANGTGQLSFHYRWNQSRCSDFYVYAMYTNTSGDTVYDRCRVVVYVPVKGITFVDGDYIVGNEIDLGYIHKGENLSLGMNITGDDWRIFLNPARMTWSLYNMTGDEMRFYTNVSRDLFSCRIYDSTLYATTNFTEFLLPGEYVLIPVYNNTYINASNDFVHAGDVSAYCTFAVPEPYYYNVTAIGIGQGDAYISDPGNYTVPILGAKAGNSTYISAEGLDPDKLVWGLTETGEDGLINTTLIQLTGYGTTCDMEVLESTRFYEYDLVVRYYNDGDPEDPEAPYVEGRLHLIHGVAIPELEAHLSEKTLKVQIYNGKNEVPLTIRSSNVSENQYLHYSLQTVEIINEELDNYVDAFIEDDGKTINLRAKSSVLALPAKELTALLKKKFSTGFIVSAVVDGNPETLTTVDNITISFGNVKPTAKNIKVNGTLEFDSYYQGEIKEITFIGGNVKELIPINATALGKQGFALIGGTRVQTTSGLPATKKGSFKAIAILDDEENYNVPENYNITVTVNYVVKNSAPKIATDVTSIQLNTETKDAQRINYYVVGDFDYGSDVGCYILDSKNKNATGALDNIDFDFDWTTNSGYFTLSGNQKTQAGQTYKFCLYAINNANGRTGAVTTITVKTVAPSNAGKKGLTLKAAGSIDASLPTQTLNITCTGKNVNLYGKGYPAVTVKLKNGTNITGNFTCSFESATSKLVLRQDCQYSDFPLYEEGLDGQAIDINVAFSVSPTETVNATYSTKIGSSKVTPKLGITKASLNPDYVIPGVDGWFYGTRVNIPITNLPGGLYNYTVALDYGNLEEAPFTYEVFEGDYDESDVVSVIPNTSALSSMLGKTCTVKITPNIPGNKGVAATCKITVLNPEKNKASVTAKATGKIDNIRDDSRVNLTISFKNVYLSESELAAIELSQIMRVEGKKEINCTKYFTYAPSDDPCTIVLKRTPGSNYSPPAGTYKAYVSGVTFDSEWDTVRINTTVTFKVVRGKAGTTVKPSHVKMINRDYARTATITVAPKYDDVNPIFDVKVVGAYADKMTIRDNLDGTYELEFNDTYVEGSIVKKIFTVISKFVTRTVQLEVYYQGSTVPDKVKAKVKINP